MRLFYLVVLASVVSAVNHHEEGEIFVFGKVGVKAEPYFLGDENHAEFVDNVNVTFRTVSAGPNAVVAVDHAGVASRIDDPSSTGSLKAPVSLENPLASFANQDSFEFCQVCRGSSHSVGVTCTGDVFTWGGKVIRHEDDAPLPLNTPMPLDLNEQRVIQITCGENHTLLLTEDRLVYTFGATSYGRLGVEVEDDVTQVSAPMFLSALSPEVLGDDDSVCFLDSGGKSSFAVTEKGKLLAWGANEFGQLGLGSVSHHVTTPTVVGGGDVEFSACEVAAGADFVIGYDDKGDIWTWGAGIPEPVRFGIANQTQQFFSVLNSRAMMVAAGEFHAAVLTDDATVYTMGYNRYGQLGVELDVPLPTSMDDDQEPDSPIWTLTPQLVPYLSDKAISSVFAAGNFTVAMRGVKTPMNCGCARGGRMPVTYEKLTSGSGSQTEGPINRADVVPSSVFGPVAPFVARQKIKVTQSLPGEVVATAPTNMSSVRGSPMQDNMAKQSAELPDKAATFFFYPSTSNEAQAMEYGADRGQSQTLFGRHFSPEGYLYGDFDAEVHSDDYTRDAVMTPTASPHHMPERDEESGMGSLDSSGDADDLKGVFSLSLQDVKAHDDVEGDLAMRSASQKAMAELRDRHAPVDFEAIAARARDHGDLSLLSTQTSVRRDLDRVLAPVN